ncbi:MAG: LysR substrate-binding domain-containing protein [Pseudomonadota bacterium]|jgi:DNA-binding transcriptional LysR family regulator
MDLPTDLLRTFIAVNDNGGFTRAAEVVHLTQSAVSMQIRRLEEIVGRDLFVRMGKSIELTPEGETLARHARQILKLQDEALSALAQPEVTGSVRLGIPDDYVSFLPPVFMQFSRTYPKVKMEIICRQSNEIHELLRKEELDLALVTANCGNPVTFGTVVRMEPLVWIAAAHQAVEMEDPIPLAMFTDKCFVHEAAVKTLEKMGRSTRVAYSSPSMAGLMAAVKSGLAVAMVARTNLPDDVRILTPDDGFPVMQPVPLELHKRPGAAVEVLAQCFMEVLKD